MKRIRKMLLVVSVVLTLLIPLGSVASADSGSRGGGKPTVSPTIEQLLDPGDGGIGF